MISTAIRKLNRKGRRLPSKTPAKQGVHTNCWPITAGKVFLSGRGVVSMRHRICRIRRSTNVVIKKISKKRMDDLTLLKTSLYYS